MQLNLTESPYLGEKHIQLVHEVLSASGWSFDRKVDLADICAREKSDPYAYPSFPLAEAFLQSFHGLIIPPNVCDCGGLHFGMQVLWAHEWLNKLWIEQRNEKVVEIAMHEGETLIINESGEIYRYEPGYHQVWLMGRDVLSGLYAMFYGWPMEVSFSIPYYSLPD